MGGGRRMMIVGYLGEGEVCSGLQGDGRSELRADDVTYIWTALSRNDKNSMCNMNVMNS